MPTLPPLTLGLDVVTPETSLREGAVRRANNITLALDGGFQQRDGYTTLAALPRAHSFWRSPAQTRALVAADDTLYDVSLPGGGVAPLFVGLTPGSPVEYVDVGPTIYFVSAGLIRKIEPDGSVRRPGVADLWGTRPTLTATVGGLLPGSYGVAYSLVNDLNEESPISSIEWIDLATGGGVLVSAIQTAANVASMKLYITHANGQDLYHHATRTYAATSSIVDQTTQKPATRMYRQPMPGGNLIRHFNGRLFVVDQNWIWISDNLDYNVSHVESGWATLKRTINMIEPVQSGVFVGMRERTVFLRAEGAKWMQVQASAHGAFEHSSMRVAADDLSVALAPNRNEPHALWLSEVGVAVGRPDGSILYTQADRIRITGGVGRPVTLLQGGIKQFVFCVESLATGPGTAVDSTI